MLQQRVSEKFKVSTPTQMPVIRGQEDCKNWCSIAGFAAPLQYMHEMKIQLTTYEQWVLT